MTKTLCITATVKIRLERVFFFPSLPSYPNKRVLRQGVRHVEEECRLLCGVPAETSAVNKLFTSLPYTLHYV